MQLTDHLPCLPWYGSIALRSLVGLEMGFEDIALRPGPVYAISGGEEQDVEARLVLSLAILFNVIAEQGLDDGGGTRVSDV